MFEFIMRRLVMREQKLAQKVFEKELEKIEVTSEDIRRFFKDNQHISSDPLIIINDEEGKPWKVIGNKFGNYDEVARLVKQLKYERMKQGGKLIDASKRFLRKEGA